MLGIIGSPQTPAVAPVYSNYRMTSDLQNLMGSSLPPTYSRPTPTNYTQYAQPSYPQNSARRLPTNNPANALAAYANYPPTGNAQASNTSQSNVGAAPLTIGAGPYATTGAVQDIINSTLGNMSGLATGAIKPTQNLSGYPGPIQGYGLATQGTPLWNNATLYQSQPGQPSTTYGIGSPLGSIPSTNTSLISQGLGSFSPSFAPTGSYSPAAGGGGTYSAAPGWGLGW